MTKKTRSYLLPAISPSLDDFKRHIRITSSDLDAELQVKLLAAINAAENMIGQVIALSRFTVTLPFTKCIPLPSRPVFQVETVSVDSLACDDYTVKGNFVILPDEMEGLEVEVTYVAGMTEVPYDIQAAVLMHAAALFNNPVDTVETLPKASTNLLRPYRHWELDL